MLNEGEGICLGLHIRNRQQLKIAADFAQYNDGKLSVSVHRKCTGLAEVQ